MDERIFEELDNLDIKETEQLLNSVNTSEFEEEIDSKTRNRIKASVLKKAGVLKEKSKKALIPKKTRLVAVSLLISIIELLFFTSAAFTAWMGGFLESSGINLSLGGIIPTVFYIIILGALALCVYKVLFNLDSEKFDIETILPGNRTSIIYWGYFIFSTVLKVLVLLLYVNVVDEIDYRFISYKIDTQFKILAFSLLIILMAVVDMFFAKIKNSLILKFEGKKEFQYNWELSIKSFLIEVLKYVGILGYIFSVSILRKSDRSNIASFIIGFVLLFTLNVFMAIIVQLKKRYCLIVEEKQENELSENKTEKSQAGEIDKRGMLKRKSIILGLSAASVAYMLCLFVPYIAYSSSIPQRPILQAFSNMDEVNAFFESRKLPFSTRLLSKGVSELTESLFAFNKLVVGTIINKPDFAMFIIEDVKFSDNVALLPDLSGNTNGSKSEGTTQSNMEYSTTNIQVDNVDEADVIKTDGKYVYYISGSELFIMEAYPPEQMRTVYRHDFLEEGLSPLELFLYEGRIAVILINGQSIKKGYSNYTVVRTYDIKDPANPKLERTFELDYRYLTSRMIENHLYIVTTANIDSEKTKPGYVDSAMGDSKREISYKDLYLMRGNASNKYRKINVVAALPVDDPNTEAQVKAYIGGGGEVVYVSTEHIYIVESTSNVITKNSMGEFFDSLVKENFRGMRFLEFGTSIYRIKIQDGKIGDFNSALVPGRVDNQFFMDEYDGYFRITTQKENWIYASSNVYVLDSDMKVCGSLEGLAPGESIYASRFMGDRLYLVTFKTVDPLFVISLKDPRNPEVLGELKIPGYSEYLHPLDENHIIGIGKDTAGGNKDFSFYQGLKMAIFDVSDVNNPKEKFVEIIGDRGSDSELLRNHKALMYMKSLELMAFPVTLYERKEENSYVEFGEFSFQGAYVYNVNSSDGFKLRGRISHLDGYDEVENFKEYQEDDDSFINRIIFSNGSLYTFSADKVKATRYSDMKEISEVDLK